MIIISDTSPIANLLQIRKLELLKLIFGRIIIPPTVDKEIRELEKFNMDLEEYHKGKWIEIIYPKDMMLLKQLKEELDEGEAEAIVLAKELHADFLLIDERLGTKKAKDQGLNTIGLLGVLMKAKEEGLISYVKPIIEELEKEAGFWISDKLRKMLLKVAGE